MQKILRLCLLTVSSFVFYSCAVPQTDIPWNGPSELKVGVSADLPPIIFEAPKTIDFTRKKKPIGLEASFTKQISKDFAIKIIFVRKKWINLIPALIDGKIDIIMSGMSITPDRAKLIDFCKPYMTTGQTALVRVNNIAEFSTKQKILNSSGKFGYIASTTSEDFVKKNCTNATTIAFESLEKAADFLLKGKIDIIIADAPSTWKISSTQIVNIKILLTEEKLAWAVNKKNKKMLESLNKLLKEWKKKSTLKKIKAEWLPNMLAK